MRGVHRLCGLALTGCLGPGADDEVLSFETVDWSVSLRDGEQEGLTLDYELEPSGALLRTEATGRLFGRGTFLSGRLSVHALASPDDAPDATTLLTTVILPFTPPDGDGTLFVNPTFPVPLQAGQNTLHLGFVYAGNPLEASGFLDLTVATSQTGTAFSAEITEAW